MSFSFASMKLHGFFGSFGISVFFTVGRRTHILDVIWAYLFCRQHVSFNDALFVYLGMVLAEGVFSRLCVIRGSMLRRNKVSSLCLRTEFSLKSCSRRA